MPFTIKTTFSFAGLEQGWQEDFYWSSATDDLQAAEAAVTPLAQKRAKLLSKDYTLTIIRNAVVTNNVGAKVLRVTDLAEPRIAGVQAWASTAPNVALMCVWQNATNTASKKQYMRGIPAGLGDLGKAPNMSFGVFLSNFNAWRSAMITFQAGWLASTVSQMAVINSYVMNATTGIVTFTLNGVGLNWPVDPGFQTRVYIKIPGRSPLDGPVSVVVVDATHCYTVDAIGVKPHVVGELGIMSIKTPTLITLAAVNGQGVTGNIHPQRIVTHKTGRPSYASRGRAAETVRW